VHTTKTCEKEEECVWAPWSSGRFFSWRKSLRHQLVDPSICLAALVKISVACGGNRIRVCRLFSCRVVTVTGLSEGLVSTPPFTWLQSQLMFDLYSSSGTGPAIRRVFPGSASHDSSKGKGKFHPVTGHEGPEKWRYSSALSLTSALDGVGGQNHDPDTLPAGKTRYPLYRRLGGPQGRSGRVRKISPPPSGYDPRTVQPVGSRYTDWAIPATQLQQLMKLIVSESGRKTACHRSSAVGFL
jgi:hypothetical protein